MFETRKCINPDCGLRYTMPVGDQRGWRCPHCHGETAVLMGPYGQQVTPKQAASTGKVVLEVLLDNVRSAWNVGAMFRASDGAGVAAVHLGGVTPTPDNPKIDKTALGASQAVPWSHHPDGVVPVREKQAEGFRVWALEGGEQAVPLFDALREPDDRPILLIVGNELTGVDPGLVSECEKTVYLPMTGYKESLNVAIAFGVAVYAIRFGN